MPPSPFPTHPTNSYVLTATPEKLSLPPIQIFARSPLVFSWPTPALAALQLRFWISFRASPWPPPALPRLRLQFGISLRASPWPAPALPQLRLQFGPRPRALLWPAVVQAQCRAPRFALSSKRKSCAPLSCAVCIPGRWAYSTPNSTIQTACTVPDDSVAVSGLGDVIASRRLVRLPHRPWSTMEGAQRRGKSPGEHLDYTVRLHPAFYWRQVQIHAQPGALQSLPISKRSSAIAVPTY